MTTLHGRELTVMEKIAILDQLKLKRSTITNLESFLWKIEKIRMSKHWTSNEVGENLALLLDPEQALKEEEEKTKKEGNTDRTTLRKH